MEFNQQIKDMWAVGLLTNQQRRDRDPIIIKSRLHIWKNVTQLTHRDLMERKQQKGKNGRS